MKQAFAGPNLELTNRSKLNINWNVEKQIKEAVSAVASGEVKASEEGKYPVKKEGGGGGHMKARAKPMVPQAHPEVKMRIWIYYMFD